MDLQLLFQTGAVSKSLHPISDNRGQGEANSPPPQEWLAPQTLAGRQEQLSP